jgi:hypothetical protein
VEKFESGIWDKHPGSGTLFYNDQLVLVPFSKAAHFSAHGGLFVTPSQRLCTVVIKERNQRGIIRPCALTSCEPKLEDVGGEVILCICGTAAGFLFVRYDNPILTRCLAPIDFLKIPAQWSGQEIRVVFLLRHSPSSTLLILYSRVIFGDSDFSRILSP